MWSNCPGQSLREGRKKRFKISNLILEVPEQKKKTNIPGILALGIRVISMNL